MRFDRDADDILKPNECFGALIFYFILFVAQLIVLRQPTVPSADALYYIDYILNLNLHGVFGKSGGDVELPALPDNASGPLYMILVSGLSYVDDGFRATMLCLLKTGTECEIDLTSLLIFNSILSAFTVVLTMLITFSITGHRVIAWASGALIFLSGSLAESAQYIAPENLMLPLLFVVVWATVVHYETPRLVTGAILGVGLGLLTLTRPSYVYLFYAYLFAFFIMAAVKRTKPHSAVSLALLLGFLIIAAPWAFRNWIYLASPALFGGNDAELVLAQRIAYNEMSWSQWAVSFVYWFPDFGDTLARTLFSPALYEPLSWNKGSIYSTALERVYHPAVQAVNGQEGVLSYLILEGVISDPFKHLAVSVALGWRAIFVGKYFGIVGVICSMIYLVNALRTKSYRFAVALLPMAFMVGFHSAISVSIDRYNLFLMLPYGIATAWVGHELFIRFKNSREG